MRACILSLVLVGIASSSVASARDDDFGNILPLLRGGGDHFYDKQAWADAASSYRDLVIVAALAGGSNHAGMESVYTRLAECQAKLKDFESAAAAIQLAIGLNRAAKNQARVAELRKVLEKYEAGVEAPKVVEKAPDKPKPKKVVISDRDAANDAFNRAKNLMREGKNDLAEDILLAVYGFLRTDTNTKAADLADVAHRLGDNRFLDGDGDALGGIRWYTEAIQHARKTSDPSTVLGLEYLSEFKIGNCYSSMGNFTKSYSHFLTLYDRVAKNPDTDESKWTRTVAILSRLEFMSASLGQASLADRHFQDMQKLVEGKLAGNLFAEKTHFESQYYRSMRRKNYTAAKAALARLSGLLTGNRETDGFLEATIAYRAAVIAGAEGDKRQQAAYARKAGNLYELYYSSDLKSKEYGGHCNNVGEQLVLANQYEEGQSYLLRALEIWDQPHCSCHL